MGRIGRQPALPVLVRSTGDEAMPAPRLGRILWLAEFDLWSMSMATRLRFRLISSNMAICGRTFTMPSWYRRGRMSRVNRRRRFGGGSRGRLWDDVAQPRREIADLAGPDLRAGRRAAIGRVLLKSRCGIRFLNRTEGSRPDRRGPLVQRARNLHCSLVPPPLR